MTARPIVICLFSATLSMLGCSSTTQSAKAPNQGDLSEASSSDELAATAPVVVETRIGKLGFTHEFADGYPTDKTIEILFEEIDFQRACQAYIWAIPLVATAQWQHTQAEVLGAENGQIVFVESYADKLGGLTYNVTTPYAIPFIDVSEGPWVVDMPEGEVRGAASDMWQIGMAAMTEPGKYLFVGPGQDVPDGAAAAGYKVIQSTTNSFLLGVRLMPTEPAARKALLEKVAIYPYAEKDSPRPRGYIMPEGKRVSAAHPRGLEFWKRLADIIDREPVAERDRLILAMLAPLGIEKGKPFAPDERQTKILEQAALVGEAMAKAIDFDKSPRLQDALYVEGSGWDVDTTSPPDQRREYYDALDGRASWFYEAVTNDIGMHGMKTGKGQVYLTAYKDDEGEWLDGARNYTLHVPPDAPAEAFWSLTLYEVNGRDIIHNKYEIADRSSRYELIKNTDGSVDLYFGPDEPKGMKANWIPTEAGRSFFAMFRFYSPGKALLDRSWVLPDIQKAD